MATKTYHFSVAFLIFMLMLSLLHSKPTEYSFKFIKQFVGIQKGQSEKGLYAVKLYLHKFGYTDYPFPATKILQFDKDDYFDDSLESAVKTYQQRHRLAVTGSLDNSTVNQMMKPRCGVPDIVNGTKKHFHGIAADYSFFPGSPKWPKRHLTYKFVNRNLQVPGTEKKSSICSTAFKKWEQVSDFTFQEVSAGSDSDIQIGFYSLDHGDNYPFDGPGGVYAHGFRPTIGKLHYDADETWSADAGPNQLDLESVTVHEIGHILGLGHSEEHPEAVMYPYLDYGERKRNLQADDIQGIHALYGKNCMEVIIT